MNNDYYRWYNWMDYAEERRSLKRDANYIGIIYLVLTGLLSVIFTVLLLLLVAVGAARFTGKYDYGMGNTRFLLVYALSYILGMGLPAPLVSLIARRRVRPFAGYGRPDQPERPLRPFSVLLALLAGMAVCILANFFASYVLAIFSQFGFQTPVMPSYMENTPVSLTLNLLIFALLPAILEEMVFRGYCLRTLRRYGNGFAVVVSSLLFALMHGNIMQIPFAFIVGMACGFLVVQTGHIWPAMMLHFMNNFMSTLLDYMIKYGGAGQHSEQLTMLVFAMLGFLGLVSLLILFITGDPIVQWVGPNTPARLTGSQKAGALVCSPAFLICTIFSLVLTVINLVEGVV